MKSKSCPFCNVEATSHVLSTSGAMAIRDKFPVTTGHTLIVPKRHVSSIFELDYSEWKECFELLKKTRDKIVSGDDSVTGFNIGINIGVDAGQIIDHGHIHLIPRRKGDMENPRGGVRNVMTGKGDYLSRNSIEK